MIKYNYANFHSYHKRFNSFFAALGIQHKPPVVPKPGINGHGTALLNSRPVSAKATKLLLRPTSAKLIIRKEAPSSTKTLLFDGPDAEVNPAWTIRTKRRTQSARARLDDTKESSVTTCTKKPVSGASKLTLEFQGPNANDSGAIKGKRKIQSADARLQSSDRAKKGENKKEQSESNTKAIVDCKPIPCIPQSRGSSGRPPSGVNSPQGQEHNNLLKPSVYGYTSKKVIFGTDNVEGHPVESLPYHLVAQPDTDDCVDNTSELEWIQDDGEPAR